MKKISKRFLGIFLSVALVCTLFTAMPVFAATADYTLDSADATLKWGTYTGLSAHMTDAKKTAGTYGIYFNHNDTASMEWTVNVPTGKAGYYKLAGRAQTAARSASTDKWSYVVKVGGTTYLDSTNNTQNTTTGWAAFADYEGGYIQLAEGSNTVNLSVSTTMTNASGSIPGIIIQYITLSFDEEKTNEEAYDYMLPATEATQEADGDGTFGTYISNGNYDYSAYFKDGYDSKLIWTVNVPEGEGGCYDFTGNLATLIRTNGADRWSFDVKVENDLCTTTIGSADNSFATTNATWTNITFNDFAPGYVKLAEGENTITVGIKFTKGDSASASVPAAALKYITLKYNATKTEEDPLPAPSLPPSHTLLAKNATQEADGDGTFGTYISNGSYDYSAYFKDGYDSKLIWTVNVPVGEGGCYDFTGNLATLIRTNGSDTWSFDVKVENDLCTTTISSADNSFATTNATWNNITFNDFAPGYVKLAEGENTITVGIKFTRGDSSSASVPAAALKHITLTYDADQTTADPLPETFIKAFSLDKATANAGDTVTATLKVMTNLKPANCGNLCVYVAQYDVDKKLVKVALDELGSAAQITVSDTVDSETTFIKAFVFDDKLMPLVDTADLPTATVE